MFDWNNKTFVLLQELITCTTFLRAITRIDLVTTPVRASRRKTFVRSFVSVAASVKIDFRVVDVKHNAILNSVLATWLFESAIQICVKLAAPINIRSIKSHVKMSAFNEDFVSFMISVTVINL